MDSARADRLAARQRLQTQGWVTPQAETFRHLPPPAADVWLGDDADASGSSGEAHPLDGAGWTLHPIGDGAQGRVDARWLDAADPQQRAELWPDAPWPATQVPAGDADAAPFAWAHRALCRQGLRLRIGGGADLGHGPSTPTWLQLRHQPRSVVEAPLLIVEVAAGAHGVLVERHDRQAAACRQPIVQNLQIHVRLGEGATLQHLRVVTPAAADRIAHHVHARLGRGARYAQALIAAGSGYHLQRSLVDLACEDAELRSAGLLLNAGAALDHQLRVAHAAAHTASVVEALALARDAARTVAHAYTRIAPAAAQAQARQRLTGIPTRGQPKLVLQPQLEILHDQVQASHGATWGALPEDALFLARQRGLDERTAQGLIVEGMAAALLQRGLDDEALAQALDLDGLLHAAVARHLTAGTPADHG